MLKASGLDKSYAQGKEVVKVLLGVDLEVFPGQRVAIVGRSGCGKSTLMHLLAGLDEVDSGDVEIMGRNISDAPVEERAKIRLDNMGFIYQAHHLLPEFTAAENVAMPLRLKGMGAKDSLKVAELLLNKIGMGERSTHRPDQLSGGERQRVAVARAVSPGPSIILADEPTGNLDSESAAVVMDLLIELTESKEIALIVVTHDASTLFAFDYVYELKGGVLTRLDHE